MRIEVYGEEETPKEQVLRLALKRQGDEVELVAVREDGTTISNGYLLTFFKDGSVKRHCYVGTQLGLQLDGIGRIDC